MAGMFRLVDRLPSPWPVAAPEVAAEPAATLADAAGDVGVFVELSTGPLAIADLIALMVAARRNCGREPRVIREFAGCRPAIAFDHPDGRPRPVASSARADVWVQAVVASACPDTFAATPVEPLEIANRRLRPPTATLPALAPARAVAGRLVTPPVVTVILPRTRRSLGRLGAAAREVLAELPRTLAGGPPPIAPPGVALSATAARAAEQVTAQADADGSAFGAAVAAALDEWRAAHQRPGQELQPPHRVTGSLTAHAAVVTRQLQHAADQEAATLRAHAAHAAAQLAPFALPQELSLSADWLADIGGGPVRLCAELCAVLDFDSADHQVIELF